MPTLFKIFVTHVVDPLNLWAHIGNDESLLQFSEFEQSLNDHCQRIYKPTDKAACPDMDSLQQKQLSRQLVLVCCPKENKILRAIITNISWDPEEVDVFYCDYGYTEFVPKENIIVDIPEYAALWPNQAWRCGLDGIQPIANTWVSRAIKRFGDLVLHQILNAHVLGVSETGMVTVDILIDETEMVRSVTDILIEEGCGMTVHSPSPEPTKSEIPDFNFSSFQKQISEDRKSDGPSIDFETDAFTRGVPQRSDSGGSAGYEGSDMKLGTGQYPSSSRNVFINIQDQIDHCKAVHAKMREDLNPIREEPPVPEHPRRKMGGRGSGRNTPVDLNDSGSPGPGRKNQGNKPYRTDSGPLPPRFQREGSRGRGSRKPSAQRESRPAPGLTDPQSALDADWGFVPASSKRDDSPSHSSASDSGTKLAPVVPEPPPPVQRPPVSLPLSEQLKNEYEWQSSQFFHKVKQTLSKATEENLNQTVEEISQLVKPEKSKFTDLPGPGELHLLIQALIDFAVVGGETKYEIALKIMDVFQTDPEFPGFISEVLWKTQARFVKVGNSKRVEELCESYCRFIGRLYISAMEWVDSGSVNVFALNTVEKWTVFNKGGQHPDPQNILELYAGCLGCFLQEAGPQLIDFLPTEMEQLFKEVRQRVLSPDVPRSAREKLLNLLLVVETNFNHATSFHVPDTSLHKEGPAPTALTATEQSQPPAFPRVVDVSTQTTHTQLAEIGVQTFLLASAIENLVENATASRKPNPADPYWKVKNMLEDLHLNELYQTFKSNAIRDSVLDSDFDDLKALLKECGVLPGQVLEIKRYLQKQVAMREKVDTVPTSFERPISPPTVVGMRSVALISPQDFEMSDATMISGLQKVTLSDRVVGELTTSVNLVSDLNSSGQFGSHRNQNGFGLQSADTTQQNTTLGYDCHPPGVQVAAPSTNSQDTRHPSHRHHHEKTSDLLIHSFRNVDICPQQTVAVSGPPESSSSHVLAPSLTTSTQLQPSPEMQRAKESLASYTASMTSGRNDHMGSPHKPTQAESQATLKESSPGARRDPRHPSNKYQLQMMPGFVKGFMTVEASKEKEEGEKDGSGDHLETETKPQSKTDNLPVLKTAWPHITDNDNDDEDDLDYYYEGQEEDVEDWRPGPKLSLADPYLGQPGPPLDAMTRRPTAEDNRKAIASNFGRNKTRYCTACGSDSHIIDECPDRTRKLFFN